MHFVKNDLIIFVFISVGTFCQIPFSVSSRKLRTVFDGFSADQEMTLFDKTQQLYPSLYYYIRLLLAGAIAIELSIQ